MKRLLFILSFAFLLVACKKKEIVVLPSSNSPVFSLQGVINGQPVAYQAGDLGMTLQTEIEMHNGVQFSYGKFSNGTTSFKLGIFDNRVTIPGVQCPLMVGDSLFFAQKQIEDLAFLSPNLLSNGLKITHIDWYANTVFLGSNNVHITEPGVYDICGIFTFENGAQKTVCNRMFLGFETDVDFTVRHFLSDYGDLKLWIEGNTQPIDSIQWLIDDELVWTGETCSQNIDLDQKMVRAKVYYSNGKIHDKTILVDGSFNGLFVEDFSAFQVPQPDVNWNKAVGLEIEMGGVMYSSFDVSNYKGSMVVKGVDNYIHPVSGAQMLRILADVDAKLKSSTTGQTMSAILRINFAITKPN